MNNIFRTRAILPLLLLVCCSCVFDADYPLRNAPPTCSIKTIESTLFYPDSTVCTLTIDDLNDAELSLSMLPCSLSDTGNGKCDTLAPLDWPGSCRFLSTGYGTKQAVLTLDTCRMGVYRGLLLFSDNANTSCTVSCSITRIFQDPFDSYPLSLQRWRHYRPDDTSHCSYDYIDKKLLFTFPQTDGPDTGSVTTGIRSTFTLPGDFMATIDFKLRDDMGEAFEIGCFASSSPGTGRWEGIKTGFFISGINGRLRLECRSVNLQSYSYETGFAAGELGISRTDSTISYFFHDGNPATTPKPLTTHLFPAGLPVHIHLKMTVYNQNKARSCHWNNFTVSSGIVSFEEEK